MNEILPNNIIVKVFFSRTNIKRKYIQPPLRIVDSNIHYTFGT